MHESPHGFLHLDLPVAGVPVAAGLVGFSGWAAGPLGVPLVALRLKSGRAFFPVTHGFPRVDLVAHFGLRQPFLPAGFEAAIFLAAGTHEIVIEALTLAGEWHAIATVRLIAEGTASPPPPPVRPLMEPSAFAQALRLVLRAATTRSLREAVRDVAGTLPLPVALRYPHLPFHGHIDQPALLQFVRFGRLCVDGWLFHETARIRRVVASVDLQTWQDLKSAGPTPHVAAIFPQFPTARQASIHGWIDIPAQLPSPLRLHTYAELPDGTWFLCHLQQTRPWDQEQEKAPFAPVGQVRFWGTALALWRACRARGFRLPWNRPLWTALQEVRREHRLRAAPMPRSPALRPAASPTTPAPHLKKVTLITHNLSREGAPLLLWEFGRHLINQGVRVHVLSAEPGPLAGLYTALGATVTVLDTTALTSAQTVGELAEAIEQLASRASVKDADLVVANTLPAYWGVHLAHRAQRPSLFCIHESTTPANFYLSHMAPATLPLIEATFDFATHISFPTDTTRVYYRPWLVRANHSINPSWINVGLIDRYLTAHSRADLRRQLGLGETDRLVVNVGILCDRKGQHIFARSVDLLWRRSPELAASCIFLMVGGRDTAFDQHLVDLLTQLGRANLRMVPASDQPLQYFGAADLAVCSSYEESFPRVVMEAMASHVPILSSRVHGIGDMLESGRSAWLMPAGQTHAMAEGLQHMLSNPGQAREFAAAARARVVAEFDSEILLPRQTALAENVSHAHS